MTTAPEEMLTYSIPQAAIALNLGADVVRALIARGDLPSMRVGTRTLIARVALAEWVDINRTATFAGLAGDPS